MEAGADPRDSGDGHSVEKRMIAILTLIDAILSLIVFIVIAQVVLSWLVAFGVVNTQNQFVYMVGDFLHRVTEPLLRPIRRILPNLGPLDISPVVLLLAIFFLQTFITRDLPRYVS